MAVTTTAVTGATQSKPHGSLRFTVKEVLLDNSYAEGGEPLTFAELGLKNVVWAECFMVNGSEEATVRATSPWYTPATAKIHIIDNATGKEVAKEKDMSKVKILVVAYGW